MKSHEFLALVGVGLELGGAILVFVGCETLGVPVFGVGFIVVYLSILFHVWRWKG